MGCSTAEGALVGINLSYGMQKERLTGVVPVCALDCIGLAVHIFRLSSRPGWIRLLGIKLDGTDVYLSCEHDFQDYVERISRSSLYASFKVTIERVCFERNAVGVPDNVLRIMFDGEPRILRSALVPANSPRYKTLLAVRTSLQDGETTSAVRAPPTENTNNWIFGHIVILLCEMDQFVFDLCRQEIPTTEMPVPEEHMGALKDYVLAPDPAKAQPDPDAEIAEGEATDGPNTSPAEPDPTDGVPDGPRGLLVALVQKVDARLRDPSIVPATEEACPLPDSFSAEAKNILTAFFGAFAYLHNKEGETLKRMRMELKFLSLFQHYVSLIREHRMVPEYVLSPLKAVITMIEEQEKGDDQPRRRNSGAGGVDFFRAAAEKTVRAKKMTAALREKEDDKKWPAA